MERWRKYNYGKIYLIYNDIDAETYVGSTYRSLDERWGEHIYMYYQYKHNPGTIKLYQHMNKICILKKWHITVIEEYSCNTKNELLLREAYWIKRLRPTLNMSIPIKKVKKMMESMVYISDPDSDEKLKIHDLAEQSLMSIGLDIFK